MVTVLASIEIKPGCVDEFLAIFKANVQNVLAENGCVEYYPAIDLPSGLPPQQMNSQLVTIVEKWTDLDALKAHLAAPHMLAYKQQVKDLVERVTLKVLQPA